MSISMVSYTKCYFITRNHIVLVVLLLLLSESTRRVPFVSGAAVTIKGRQIEKASLAVLGRGFSIATGSFQSSCLDGANNILSEPSYDYDYYFTDFTRDDVDWKSLLVGKISNSFSFLEVKSTISTLKEKEKLNEDQTSDDNKNKFLIAVTMRIDRYHSTLNEEKANISEEAKMLLRDEDYVNFFASCGPNYVRAIHRAQEVTALFTFEATNILIAQKFSSWLQLFLRGKPTSLTPSYPYPTNKECILTNDENELVEPAADGEGNGGSNENKDFIQYDMLDGEISYIINNSLSIQVMAYGIGLNNPDSSKTFAATSMNEFNNMMKSAFISMTKTSNKDGNDAEGKIVDIELIPWTDNVQFQLYSKMHDHNLRMPIPRSLIEDASTDDEQQWCLSPSNVVDDYDKCCKPQDLVVLVGGETSAPETTKKRCEPLEYVPYSIMRDNIATNGEFVTRLDSLVRDKMNTLSKLGKCVIALNAIPEHLDYHYLHAHSSSSSVQSSIYDGDVEFKLTVQELRMALNPTGDMKLITYVGKERDEFLEMFYRPCLAALQGRNIGNNKFTDPLYFMAIPWYNHKECSYLTCLDRNMAWDRNIGNGCVEGLLRRGANRTEVSDQFCAKRIDPETDDEVCTHVIPLNIVEQIDRCWRGLPQGKDGRGRSAVISVEYLMDHFCLPELAMSGEKANSEKMDAIDSTWETCLQGNLESAPPTQPPTTNIALNGVASQSSTSHGAVASRAIDGDTSGLWNNGSVAHTNRAENNWWKVNLKGQYVIKQIIIWNRTDCCKEYLSYAILDILSQDGKTVIASFNIGDATDKENFVFDMSVYGASWVHIRLPPNNYLYLAEVEVFGRRL